VPCFHPNKADCEWDARHQVHSKQHPLCTYLAQPHCTPIHIPISVSKISAGMHEMRQVICLRVRSRRVTLSAQYLEGAHCSCHSQYNITCYESLLLLLLLRRLEAAARCSSRSIIICTESQPAQRRLLLLHHTIAAALILNNRGGAGLQGGVYLKGLPPCDACNVHHER
jgi:hypothetical protein